MTVPCLVSSVRSSEEWSPSMTPMMMVHDDDLMVVISLAIEFSLSSFALSTKHFFLLKLVFAAQTPNISSSSLDYGLGSQVLMRRFR